MKFKTLYGSLLFIQIVTAFIILMFTNRLAYSIIGINDYPNKIHKILYIDPKFDDKEFVFISLAASEWTETTNHIVTFEVKKLPQKKLNFNEGIIILKVDQYNPNIISLDSKNNFGTLGFCDIKNSVPNIQLVSYRMTDEYYKATVLHELGHALGLEHNEDIEGIGTLMYPAVNLGADHITETDLENFCKLYHCDAKKLANN